MSIRRDIVANYLGAGICAIAPILALPLYINILGLPYWGLVSFISILISVLGLANAGLAQTLVREFSLLSANKPDSLPKIASIAFGFERIYWIFSISGGIALACLSEPISLHWINLATLPPETGIATVFSASAIFVVQFPVTIYRSVLAGCGAQVRLNWIMSLSAIFKHAGGVGILLLHPNIYSYLLWLVFSSFLETSVTAQMCWHLLDINRKFLQWDWNKLRPIAIFASGMSASVMLGMLAMQLDKLFISLMLPIEELGYYSIASTLALGMLQIFSPLASAVQPRIVLLQNQATALREINTKIFLLMFVILGLFMASAILSGKTLLTIWLHDTELVNKVFPITLLLMGGSCMNGLYNIGYMNWLAAGSIRKIFGTNLIALILTIIFTPMLIHEYGLTGAAFGWLVLNLTGMFLSLGWSYIPRNKNA